MGKNMVKEHTVTLMEEKKLGEFREGKEWNVIGYDQNGNEKIKWVNGKIEQ